MASFREVYKGVNHRVYVRNSLNRGTLNPRWDGIIATSRSPRAAASQRRRLNFKSEKLAALGLLSDFLHAIQNEIQRHNLSTFMSKEHKIVQTGCSVCEHRFGTVEQFKRHPSEDVLPPLLDRLSSEARNAP